MQIIRLFGRKIYSTKTSTKSVRYLKPVSSTSLLRNRVKDVPCDTPMGKVDPDLYIPHVPIEIWIYILQFSSRILHRFLHPIAEPPDSSSAFNTVYPDLPHQ